MKNSLPIKTNHRVMSPKRSKTFLAGFQDGQKNNPFSQHYNNQNLASVAATLPVAITFAVAGTLLVAATLFVATTLE